MQYNWMETAYSSPQEDIDTNATPPKGKPVRLSSYFDANLMHNVAAARSTIGILEFINQTPTDWFSKLLRPKVKAKTLMCWGLEPQSLVEAITNRTTHALRLTRRYVSSLPYTYARTVQTLTNDSKLSHVT